MISLRQADKDEFPDIVSLANKTFGDGYMDLSEVSERYIIVQVDGKVAGFANTDLWDEDDFEDSGFSLGLIETVAVDLEYRGCRLGDLLVSGASSQLIREGVQLIEVYATTWSNTGICYIESALKRYGFVVKEEMPGYWKDDPPSYTCRACQKSPCHCDATLYQLEINTR